MILVDRVSPSPRRTLALLAAGLFLSRAASRALLPFLPMLVRDLGSSQPSLWAGWILSAPFLLSALTTPWWGHRGDRIGRVRITVFAACGGVAGYLAMAAAPTLELLLVAALVQELFGGFYPALMALGSASSSVVHRTRNLGILQGAAAIGNVVGPLAGGLLAAPLGQRGVLVCLALALAGYGLLLLLLGSEPGVRNEAGDRSSGVLSNLRAVKSHPVLRIASIGLFAYAFAIAGLRPGLPLFLESLLTDPTQAPIVAGTVFSLFGAMGILPALLVGPMTRRWPPRHVLVVVFVVSGCSLLLAGLMPTVLSVALPLVLAGLAVGVILPINLSRLGTSADPRHLTGITGIGSGCQILGNLAGPALFGALGAYFGYRSPFYLAGLVFLLTALMEFRARDEEARPRP